MHQLRAFRLISGLALAVGIGVTLIAQSQEPPAKPSGLQFRFLGPAVGNRAAAIAGVPGDPSVYYVGAASGGVWKSIDAGLNWTPIFDSQPVAAIGALAVAPSEPTTVWAGTGEPWAIRDIDVMGDGVYKSVDAGKTWTHMGLDQTGRIARVIVHPRNPDIVFVCAVGRTSGPQQERGVFRTTDGGQHWERVLFVDENTGCSGLSMDPNDPRTLVAGTWQVEMHTWAMFSGGPGSGVFVSHDGGTTWTRVEGHGLPKSAAREDRRGHRAHRLEPRLRAHPDHRPGIGLALRRRRPVVARGQLAARRSSVARATTSASQSLRPTRTRSWWPTARFWVSTDGGASFRETDWGGDTHDIWIDPRNPDRFVITDDGGLIITQQHGRSFMRPVLPIGQMYHVAVDNQVPYNVYSNMQDDGTIRGPVTPAGAAPRTALLHRHAVGAPPGRLRIGLHDSRSRRPECGVGLVLRQQGHPLRRPLEGGAVGRAVEDHPRLAAGRREVPLPLDLAARDRSVRSQPRATTAARSSSRRPTAARAGRAISPDLSTNDPRRIVSSGGIVGDNLGQFYGEVVFAIAPSEVQKGLIWAGTNDGQVWVTKNGGGDWTNVTKKIVGLPAWGTITRIEPSHFDAGTAYIAVDFHLMDNRDPFIYKTADFGQTWKKLSDGLPAGHPLAYVRTVAESPNRKGLLFAGTGHGFYYSLDDGAHWTELQAGLPHAPVTWIATQKAYHDVVVSTYGRGLYVLDDVSPLEQMAADSSAAPVRLFTPRPTYRYTDGGQALVDFSLAAAPKAPVKIEILDAQNAVVRTLDPAAQAGLNRVRWDLRYEGPHQVALRATPPENAHLFEEPRFRGKQTRPVTHWGLEDAGAGPWANPGKYTVRLTVDGRAFSAPLEILKAPKIPGSDADLAASLKLQLRIRDDITEAADMVNQIEIVRRELEEVQTGLRAGKNQDVALKDVAAIMSTLVAVEDRLLEPAARLSDDKYYQQAYRVYTNLLWLTGEVGPGAGDVAGGFNFKPTDTSFAVLETIEKDLADARVAYRAVMDKDVPAYWRARAAGK